MEVFIIRDGEQMGPFEDRTVQEMLAEGKVSHEDYAWRTGMSAWIPLREVMGSAIRSSTPPPAPVESGIRSASGNPTPPKQHAQSTAKQRALLSYLGIQFTPDVSKEQAAALVSEALENPQFYSRLMKWNVEKFKLHPDIFADELDAKRHHRAAYYHELCQIEGKEIVQNITEAHCKVLIESLDNRFPSWEANPKESLWDYFLPMLNEHFPQLVSTEWRQRLKMGGTKLPGALTHAIPASAKLHKQKQLSAPPSQFQAAIKGLVYGLLLLGAIIGGIVYFQKDNKQESQTADTGRGGVEERIEAVVETPVVDKQPAPSPDPAPAEELTIVETPMPEPDATAVVPETTETAPSAPRDIVTLKKTVEVKLQYGKVKLPPGTKLKFVAQEGQHVSAKFNDTLILVPVTATDFTPSAP